MVILENPGEAQSIEDRRYGGKTGRALADAAWNQSAAVLERTAAPRWGGGRGASHDPLMRHLAEDVFGCPLNEVLDRAVITNVVRCSTPRAFGEYRPGVRLAIGTECVRRHLIPEIAYWQPRFIVACGEPVKELLLELRRQGVVVLEFFEAHHPSALGQAIGQRKNQFAAIGEQIRKATPS
jgi:hypothetical protein